MKTKASSEGPAELSVKNSSSQQTNTNSSRKKEKTKKNAQLADGMAKKMLLVGNDSQSK